MSSRDQSTGAVVNSTENLACDVFINEPPPHDNGRLPSGEPKGGSPVSSTLIYGKRDAVLTDRDSRQNRRVPSAIGSMRRVGT